MVTNISWVTINAPVRDVWVALTTPVLVREWQYGSELITDWSIGGEIRFISDWEGSIYEQWGKILEIIPYKKLRYSLFAPSPGLEDKPENYFIMSYILTEINGQIKLEIIQEDDRPNAVQEEPQVENNPMLIELKLLIEDNI